MSTFPLPFSLKDPHQRHLGIAISVLIHAGVFSALAISQNPMRPPSFEYPMIEVATFSSALSQQPASTTSTSPLDPKSLPQKAVIAPIAKTVPQARPNRVLKSIPTATKQRETTSSKAEAHPESPGSNSAAFSNSKSGEATGSADTTIPPDFHSASLHNPPTAYPLMAARRGIEGIVKLKVQVLPNGEPGLIELATSSGADVLDTSAIEQVRKWRFIPARRKNVAVTGWVIVPLVFELTR